MLSSQVILSDPANLGAATDDALIHDLQVALQILSQYVSGLGTLDVALDIVPTAVGRADGSFTSSVFTGKAPDGKDVFEPSSLYELSTGQHVGGTTSDMFIELSPDYLQRLDLSQNLTYNSEVAANLYNPIVIFLHELIHGLGMAGAYTQAGTNPNNYEFTYDTFVQTTASGVYFTGPHAEAANGGAPVVLTSSSTTQNVYHLGNTLSDISRTPATIQDPTTLDLMNGTVFYYDYQYAISPVDLGILKDLGYTLTSLPTLNINSITASGPGITTGSGDLSIGDTVTFTVALNDAATVSTLYGTPALSLSNGSSASYVNGSGTNHLQFQYAVTDGQDANDISITSLNLNGGTITDDIAQALNVLGAQNYNPTGILAVDATRPVVSSITLSGLGITGGNGDLVTGNTVVFKVALSEEATIAGGNPLLVLNDGGVAVFDAAHSSSSVLAFDYMVHGESTSDLSIAFMDVAPATIRDAAGNDANFDAAFDFNPPGILQINSHPTAVLPPLQGLTTTEQQTEAMYIAYFSRAGDPGGTYYWMGNLEDGQTIDDVAMNFANQEESRGVYPFLKMLTTDSEANRISFIDSIYENLFNRAPDPDGLNYWDHELANDQKTLTGNDLFRAVGGFILEVIRGALNTDAGQDITAILNKVQVASYFTDQLAAQNVAYANNQPTVVDAQAHSVVAATSSNATSVIIEKVVINADVSNDLFSGDTSLSPIVGIAAVQDFQS